jgi:hypothetical protein
MAVSSGTSFPGCDVHARSGSFRYFDDIIPIGLGLCPRKARQPLLGHSIERHRGRIVRFTKSRSIRQRVNVHLQKADLSFFYSWLSAAELCWFRSGRLRPGIVINPASWFSYPIRIRSRFLLGLPIANLIDDLLM